MAWWGWVAIAVALAAATYTTSHKRDGKDRG